MKMKFTKIPNLLSGDETPFQITFTERVPNYRFVGDMHYELQLCVLLSGSCQVMYPEYDEFLRCLTTGQAYFAACWEPHACKFSTEGEMMVLSFPIEELLQWRKYDQDMSWKVPFLVAPEFRPYGQSVKARDKLLALALGIKNLEAEKPYAFRTREWLKIQEIIIELLTDWEKPVDTTDEDSLWRILPAINLVNKCGRKNVALNEAAKECGLSRSRFSLIFTKAMGLSFNKFFIRSRMSRAVRLLRHTNEPIKSIAVQCGFNSASSFNHAFMKYHKTTPFKMRNGKVMTHKA